MANDQKAKTMRKGEKECVSVETQRRQHYHVPIQALATGDCPPLATLKQADPPGPAAQACPAGPELLRHFCLSSFGESGPGINKVLV